MCGIVGYVGPKDCSEVLVNALTKLEYRGYDSAGIAVFDNGEIKTVKTKGKLQDLKDKLAEVGTPKGHVGIGHPRWATHGEPSDVNSHPHSGTRVTIVHNGIIENYMELKDFLISKGRTFLSDTDTEVVAQLLDYKYNGNPLETIDSVMAELKGSFALGIMFKDFPDRVFAVRRESPLIVGVAEGECFIASDVPAIIKYTKDYYLLDENEIAVLTQDSVHVYDLDGEEIQKELHTANWDVEAAEKGGYPHFMIKEIHEQPSAFRNTVSPRIIDGLPDLQLENLSDEHLKSIERIHIVACGTAMHAGMVGKYVIEEMARIPVDVDVASEFRYRNPILGKNDLVVIISQSGETADTLAALRLAKQQGVPTLAIVNVVGSSIAREADNVMYTWAGPEIAVATTKAYSAQLAAVYLLAIHFGRVRGNLDDGTYQGMIEELLLLPDKISRILEEKERIQWFANKFSHNNDVFFIGRGLDYAASMEGSLKLKEISYMHSEAYAAGELKHGTISLIEQGTLVIGVLTQSELYEKTISNMLECKSRGAYLMGLTTYGKYEIEDQVNFTVYVPKVDEHFVGSLAVIPLQLLGYYVSVAKGLDVDKPRNLAKSVTVE